jgi:putative membrane protein insertion efficiency factor
MTLQRILVELVLLPVRFYRRVLSPMKRTPSCRYLPTCSEYAIEAVQTRGVIVGTGLAISRVLRCNPLFHAGHDPVPVGRSRQLSVCSHGERH